MVQHPAGPEVATRAHRRSVLQEQYGWPDMPIIEFVDAYIQGLVWARVNAAQQIIVQEHGACRPVSQN